MRHLLILGVVLTAVHLNAVQVNGPQNVVITITPSQTPGGYATVGAWGTEPYTEGPFAGIAAQPATTGANVNGLKFGIRAWRESDKTRVVVYAVLDDQRSPNGRTETPIRTFTMSPGQTLEIPEVAKWGAAPVSVKATVRDR